MHCVSSDGPSSKTPQEARVSILSEERCREAYKSFPIGVIDESAICAGDVARGEEACQVGCCARLK